MRIAICFIVSLMLACGSDCPEGKLDEVTALKMRLDFAKARNAELVAMMEPDPDEVKKESSKPELADRFVLKYEQTARHIGCILFVYKDSETGNEILVTYDDTTCLVKSVVVLSKGMNDE